MDKYELAEMIAHRVIELREQTNHPSEFDCLNCIVQLLCDVKHKVENMEFESQYDVVDFINDWEMKENNDEKLVIENDNCTITIKEGSIEVKTKRD